jgi:hypothetical protein
MNNTLTFAFQLITTLIIAAILSAVLYGILAFTLANLDMFYEKQSIIRSIADIVFGLAVGYRLNDLVRTAKK